MNHESSGSSGAVNPSVVAAGTKAPAKKDSPLMNLMLSLVIPILILKKLSDPVYLGPIGALGLALIFPLSNGLLEMRKRRKFGLIPILGIINVLLTGGIVIVGASGFWFAVKEAVVPLIIALTLYVSHAFGKPLIRPMFINDQLVHVERVDEALRQSGKQSEFDEEMNRATYLIVLSFMISAVLNFSFAYYMVTGQPGTTEFNDQVANMHLFSFGAILLSCSTLMVYALFRLGQTLRKITGLSWDEILRT